MIMATSYSTPPIVDSAGRSPWVGKARTFDEYRQIDFPRFDDPYKIKPGEDLFISGVNGIDGMPTRFRLGTELWRDGAGFLYREALSCGRTRLNARMRAAIQFMQEHIATVSTNSIYLTEMVTPLYEFLQGRYPLLQASEYLPAVPLGAFQDGIRSEDLLSLTFDDNSFDVILTCDVLEHVSPYKIAIHELARTLKPGGHLVMTAPMIVDSDVSHSRAVINDDGEIQHLLPPEYHGNPLGPPSLCFTTFGFDVVEQLRKFGFSDSFLQFYYNVELGYWGNPEVLLIATK